MTKLEILHYLELKIAAEVKRVCNKCGITFFLFNGSLLGAVRHKGFIPWDDDMDIAMPRDDYEKFIRVFPKNTDSSIFFLENWYTEKNFGLPFSKVKLNGTVFEEHSIKNIDVHKGIYVDVFPLDFLPDNRAIIDRTAEKLNILGKIYKFRLGYLPTNPDNSVQHFLSRVIGTVTGPIPQSLLQRMILQKETKYNGDTQACFAALLGGSGNHTKDAFHRKLIENTIMVPFESDIMPIPVGYDEILSIIYGNYMRFPPAEQRVFRHNPEKIEFGIYNQ